MKGRVLGENGLHMSETDNVITAIDDLESGITIPYEGSTIELREDVPFGHKVALVPISSGDTVIKYGEPIGTSTVAIDAGEWVHTHNCESARGRGDKVGTESEGI